MPTQISLATPASNYQNDDDFLLYPWQQDTLYSSGNGDTATLLSGDFFYPFDPPQKDFGNWRYLNAMGSAPQSLPSPNELVLESPVSAGSSELANDTVIEPFSTGDDCVPEYLMVCESLNTNIVDIHTHKYSPSASTQDSTECGYSSPIEIQEVSQKRRHSKKRQQQPTQLKAKPALPHKTAHNLIEKRYRLRLNSKFEALRNCLPIINDESSNSDADGQVRIVKINKATIISKAIEHIARLEEENKRLAKECAEFQLNSSYRESWFSSQN